MKKILVFVMCASLFTATANAQTFKQAGGEKNFEVNFAPLGGSPVSIGGIKFRKFNSTGTSAMRLNVFVGTMSEKTIDQQADTSGNPELTTKNSSFNISIRPGFEKHMAGTDRLSPYVGAEIAFTLNTSKEVAEGQNGDKSINKTTTKNTDGYTAFGANLFCGTDFYFAKNIYLGAEFGFGFNLKSMSDEKVEYSDFTPTNPANPEDVRQGSTLQLGPTYIGTLRLGWLF